MLLAAVVYLEALSSGVLTTDTGPAVQGLWFARWKELDAALATAIHSRDGDATPPPYTLSPLLGLPLPRQARVDVATGARAWLRITVLDPALTPEVLNRWLPNLPEFELPTDSGLFWAARGFAARHQEHPWAAQVDQGALVRQSLLTSPAPCRWMLEFARPTTFRSGEVDLPFPLPELLVRSWMDRWQTYGLVPLPKDLPERVRDGIMVSRYELRTACVPASTHSAVGFVGQMSLEAALRMRKQERVLTNEERSAVDLLCHYAFFAGTGRRTAQGMGMTQLL